MYLATTAETAYWNVHDELLILGTWCLRYDRRIQWQDLRYTILPNPWEDPRAIEAAEAYCRGVIEAMIHALAATLNQLHGTSWGTRYWRILVEPWLLYYVHALYDRYRSLQEALARSPGLTTTVLDPSSYRPSRDLLDFLTLVNGESADQFNLQLYSQILQSWGLASAVWKTVQVDNVEQSMGMQDAAQRPSSGHAGVRVTHRLKAAAVRTLQPRVMVGGVGLTRRQRWQFLWAMAQKGGAWPAPDYIRCQAQRWNPAMRRELGTIPSRDAFTAVVVDTLPTNFPRVFLEGYGEIRAAALNLWPRVPKAVVSYTSWLGDETFQFLAAEFGERGARLIGGQHGGGYGTYRVHSFERYETSVMDRWFSFGWRDEASGRPVSPLPRPQFARRAARNGHHPPRGRALVLITTSHPRYPSRLDASPVGQFTTVLEWRDRLLQRLTPTLSAQLIVRLPLEDYGWCHRARIEDRYGAIRLSLCRDESFHDLLRQAKLVVVEYPGTAYLELLSANLPTVLYWDPSRWPMREEAEPQFASLRQAGILWDSPEAAAAHIETVMEHPWAWWDSPAVQEARSGFVERHALGRADWLPRWVQVLATELDAGRTPAQEAAHVAASDGDRDDRHLKGRNRVVSL